MYLEYRTQASEATSKKSLDERTPLVADSYGMNGTYNEDRDVINERQRVAECDSDAIIVRGMRKEYPDGERGTKVGKSPMQKKEDVMKIRLISHMYCAGCS